MKKLTLATTVLAIIFLTGCASTGGTKGKESTTTGVDRLSGVGITVTSQTNDMRYWALTLKTIKNSDGREGREFILAKNDWLFIEKITMKIDGGGGGNWVSWDHFEVERDIKGYGSYSVVETAPLMLKKEVDDWIKPFGVKLKEAQKKGDVSYFIRVEGKKKHIDFNYTLKADAEIPTFFK